MTNIKCKIFDSQGKYICEKDIAEIQKGDYVKSSDGLCKVTGKYYDNGIDYMIPTENYNYSPLCLE